MKQLYRKVIISGDANWPKISGEYIVAAGREIAIEYFNPDDAYDQSHWREDVEWYLQPIEQPEPDTNTPFNSGAKIPTKSEDELDLMQYVTNLLYDAYEQGIKTRIPAGIGEGVRNVNTDEFDKWAEKEVDNISKYYSQFKSEQRNTNMKILNTMANQDELLRDQVIDLFRGWIDVKIQKPIGDVLLLTTSKSIDIGDWYDGIWRTKQSLWESGVLKSVYETDDITHWMPLPSIEISQSEQRQVTDELIVVQDIDEYFHKSQGTDCKCKHSSWNRDAGCFVCDDCGEKI